DLDARREVPEPHLAVAVARDSEPRLDRERARRDLRPGDAEDPGRARGLDEEEAPSLAHGQGDAPARREREDARAHGRDRARWSGDGPFAATRELEDTEALPARGDPP